MSDLAIHCEHLSKRYRLGQQESYKALRDVLTHAASKPLRQLRSAFGKTNGNGHRSTPAADVIWALDDVSFEVKRGEVVGIIGRNGSGKSTLLKILSRITKPTRGEAKINGRVGSLLEVGTGFHPELTGRENIYLNGAILGMRRKEIDYKFDEIVAFAEIEKFIDTPVKRYSSGMYVRLAFAVAAHMETEVLLVDEVLAVGDAAFQKKCLGKMGDVAKTGRTVLFVSHNISAIRSLCQKSALLHKGELVAFGETAAVVSTYESGWITERDANLAAGTILDEPVDSKKEFQVFKIEALDREDSPLGVLSTWDFVKFRIHYHARRSVINGSMAFTLSTIEQVPLLLCSTQPDSNVPMSIEAGTSYVDCEFASWPFSAGRYLVTAALAIPMKEWLTDYRQAAVLEVEGRDVFESGIVTPNIQRSLLAIPHSWKIPQT